MRGIKGRSGTEAVQMDVRIVMNGRRVIGALAICRGCGRAALRASDAEDRADEGMKPMLRW